MPSGLGLQDRYPAGFQTDPILTPSGQPTVMTWLVDDAIPQTATEVVIGLPRPTVSQPPSQTLLDLGPFVGPGSSSSAVLEPSNLPLLSPPRSYDEFLPDVEDAWGAARAYGSPYTSDHSGDYFSFGPTSSADHFAAFAGLNAAAAVGAYVMSMRWDDPPPLLPASPPFIKRFRSPVLPFHPAARLLPTGSGQASPSISRPPAPATRSFTQSVTKPAASWRGMAGLVLDSLGNLPGNPVGLWKYGKTAAEMARAFESEKTFVEGVTMALNVVNPLYLAEVARFEAGEAADRGDNASAASHGVLAALGYLQTLAMATGAARGLARLGPAPVTPPAMRSPGLLTRIWRSEEGSWSGFAQSGPAPTASGATRASVPFASLGRVAQITSRGGFRRFVTRTLQDPKHPLHRVLDPATMRLRPSTTQGLTRLEWFEDPRIVEAGHWSSAKDLAGAVDRLIIMSAYENRLVSAVVEHPSIGGVMSESGRVVAIGGLPVDLLTAEALVEFEVLVAEVLDQAPFVTF